MRETARGALPRRRLRSGFPLFSAFSPHQNSDLTKQNSRLFFSPAPGIGVTISLRNRMDTPAFNSNQIFSNEKKRKIGESILERYTGSPLDTFQKQILLTNFEHYMKQFRKITGCKKPTKGSAMSAIHSEKHG